MKQKKLVSTDPILRHFDHDLSKRWFFEWYDKKGIRAKRYGQLARYDSVDERLAAAEQLRVQMATGLLKPKPTSSVIYQHIKEILTQHSLGLRPASVRNYNTCLRIFEEWLLENNHKNLHPKKFQKLEVAAFLRYLELDRSLANRTYNRYVQLFKTLFNKLLDIDVIDKNPFQFIKAKVKNSESATAFKELDMIKLREVFKVECPTLYFACMLQMYAFIRPGEIRQLRVSDINLEEGIIQVLGDISKNKKTQRVAIVAPLREIILAYLGEANSVANNDYLISKTGHAGEIQVSTKFLSDNHKRILTKLNYDTTKFQLYSWKHTGNALAYKNGAALRFLKLQNRHHSEVMTEIYIKSIVPEDLISTQEQFFNF